MVLQPENWRWGGGWREIQRVIERERDAFTPYAKEKGGLHADGRNDHWMISNLKKYRRCSQGDPNTKEGHAFFIPSIFSLCKVALVLNARLACQGSIQFFTYQ